MVLQTEQCALGNGIRLLVTPNMTAEIVVAKVFFRDSGVRVLTQDQPGLANLVAAVMTKGTKLYEAIAIAEQVELSGANLGVNANFDYFSLGIKSVTSDFGPMMALLGEIIQNPSFPEAELDRERMLAIQALRSRDEQPFNVAFRALNEAMYPAHHPYYYSPLGEPEAIKRYTSQDLKDYHQQFLRPETMVISIAGHITPDEAKAIVEPIFKPWQPPAIATETMELPPLPPLPDKPTYLYTPRETQQAIIMLGYRADALTSPHHLPLKLINTYLGNGLSSRLFVELREKQGLAYDVSTFYSSRIGNSQFVAYIGTAPENITIAVEGLWDEMDRLGDQLLPDEELAMVKNKFLGQYALGKQTNGEIAQIAGLYETLGLGVDYDHHLPELIKAIDAPTIQTVAQTHLIKPYLSIVAPEESLNNLVLGK